MTPFTRSGYNLKRPGLPSTNDESKTVSFSKSGTMRRGVNLADFSLLILYNSFLERIVRWLFLALLDNGGKLYHC